MQFFERANFHLLPMVLSHADSVLAKKGFMIILKRYVSCSFTQVNVREKINMTANKNKTKVLYR